MAATLLKLAVNLLSLLSKLLPVILAHRSGKASKAAEVTAESLEFMEKADEIRSAPMSKRGALDVMRKRASGGDDGVS